MEPFMIEQWWLVVRLERYTPASFDEAMALQMASELFEERVKEETARTLRQFSPQAVHSRRHDSDASCRRVQDPAFSGLSYSGRSRLESDTRYVRFRLGQIVSDPTILPARIHLLVAGEARLLGHENGRLVTLCKVGPGAVLGMASLLRGKPCENLSAAAELVAASISDQVVVDLYRPEPGFQQWCNTTLWPAEATSSWQPCSNVPLAQSNRSPRSWRALCRAPVWWLLRSRPSRPWGWNMRCSWPVRMVTRDTSETRWILATSPIPHKRPSSRAADRSPLELFPGDGPIRETGGAGLEPSTTGQAAAPLLDGPIEAAPEVPMASSLDIGLKSGLSGFRLVRGQGPLQETLACFQMVARLTNLPFRRDSIEKVLRDAMRRGQVPDLQLCGQLAASLGLHVRAVRVPAAMGTRLQPPCLLPWKEGFAVAIESNNVGLRLVSPSEGVLILSPAELTERYPEGMNVLVMDRANTTPEDTFGVGWFWPALKRYRGVLLQVLAASFVVQLFTLANPLLIQVIIDKVINQRSLDTLQVLGIALVAVTLLEGVLGSLRTFLFAETTNRIDQRLGAEVIDHLLRLPLTYFDHRPVGELGSRVAELEKIRNFLTGQPSPPFSMRPSR